MTLRAAAIAFIDIMGAWIHGNFQILRKFAVSTYVNHDVVYYLIRCAEDLV